MTNNASHVVVHHYLGNGLSLNLFAMVCCVVLSIVNLLMLVLFIALLIYVINRRPKSSSPPPPQPPPRPEGPPEAHPNPAYIPGSEQDQSTPMATFVKTDGPRGSRANSSLSSAGLCEVLFPPKHEGEVIYQTPPPQRRLVTIAGRVYATPRPGVSNPGRVSRLRRSVPHVASMEWDYFEPNRCASASVSDEASQTDRENARDVCWV